MRVTSSSAQQALSTLGSRLRELRRDAGLSGRDLARLAGWHSSKVSKIEHGRQAPMDSDIATWCTHCRADDQAPDLIAAMRAVEVIEEGVLRSRVGGCEVMAAQLGHLLAAASCPQSRSG